MARRDRFSRGGDHSALNAEGFAAIGFRESQRELREAARRRRHDRRRGLPLSRPERACECRRAWRRWRWRRRRRSSSARAASRRSIAVRPATTRTCAGRRRPARPATASSGATPGRPTGSTSSTVGNVTEYTFPEGEHRRLGLRGGCGRRRRAREHGQRLCGAPPRSRRVEAETPLYSAVGQPPRRLTIDRDGGTARLRSASATAFATTMDRASHRPSRIADRDLDVFCGSASR